MAQTSSDYFASGTSSRPTIRTRAPASASNVSATSPASPSPRTPLLGRSISSQFGSPGAFRAEQEDFVVYEIGSRHLAAGFAGESRPRCVLGFGPEDARRVGDYRQYDPSYQPKRATIEKEEDWGAAHELYRVDVRSLDLGLVEDRVERVIRRAHVEFLQLDNKPRKAILAVPSLLPMPVLEIVLKVLFNHSAQPPAVTLLTTPVLACVGAGLRNGLIVDIGWEESTVTAVGEYKEIFQRRTARAGSMLTRAIGSMLEEERTRQVGPQDDASGSKVNLEYAEDVTQRLAWCQAHGSTKLSSSAIKIPRPDSKADEKLSIMFSRFSEKVETTFFPVQDQDSELDDHNMPLTTVMYNVLLALPPDCRALCLSRIVLTGPNGRIPGLRHRLLQELHHMIGERGWDPVHNYGSATANHDRALKLYNDRVTEFKQRKKEEEATSNGEESQQSRKPPNQDSIPAHGRVHDDKHDHISLKAEREAARGQVEVVKGVVRGVETLGAWSGASMIASLRVKGACEVERDEFMRHGLRDVNF